MHSNDDDSERLENVTGPLDSLRANRAEKERCGTVIISF